MKYQLIYIISVLLFFSCEKDTPILTEESTDIYENSEGISDMELQVVNLINEFRAAGAVCGADDFVPAQDVYWNKVLDKASEMHADDMASNGFISHTGSDGSAHTDRLLAVDYDYMFAGENVAKGPTTAAGVVQEFKDSPSHCKVMMNPDYVHVGIAKIGKYWVINFAHPRKF